MRRWAAIAAGTVVVGLGLAWAFRVAPPPGPACPPGSGAPISGRLVVTNQQSGTVSIVELATGDVTHLPVAPEPHGVAASADGRWAVAADYGARAPGGPLGGEFDGNTLIVIDLVAKRIARRIETGEHRGLHDVAFLPGTSARVVVTAQRSREVIEVDLESGQVVTTIPTEGYGTHSLAVSADGRFVYAANEEGTEVSVLELAAGAFRRHLALDTGPIGIAATPDGRHLWVGIRDGIRVLDPVTGQGIAMIPGFAFPDDIAIGRDGRMALVAAGRGGAHLVDVARRETVLSFGGRAHAADLTPDGRFGFVTLGRRNEVAVLDLTAGCVAARHRVGRGADDVAWAPGHLTGS